MFNLELLLPVGSIENFFAAIRGGADAVYLGLKNFNARKKAKNFSYTEVFNLVREAHKNNVKVFITINTLIKNSEISELIKTLEIVSQIKPDAIIIQDFAIANLVKKYFNNIKIHASTQLASHNSADCVFFKKQGFERVILARELTENELISISKNSDIQKEIFVHGALCYSFSGHCLFSSFLGGNSANRGMCTQVCRRNFISENQKEPFFSLKDLQLINNIPLFSKLKINSLKIEGRMKSPEYVYVTSKAYRNAIDNFDMIEKSEEQLEQDFGREKTDFFFGKNISESISENPSTGIFLGKIFKLNSNSFQIISNIDLTKTSKLRVRIFSDTETEYIKIQKIEKNQNNKYTIYCNTDNLIENIEIFHVGNIINTTNSFTNYIDKKFQYLPDSQIKAIVNSF
ncbi:MAG: U32 family peptidase, partial [Bacteroidales bacterium]|nr:U32 family peptidase [Bacteroidales bacterium]